MAQSQRSPIGVFVADDHELIREALRMMIASDAGLRLAGEAASASEALDRIPKAAADVVVMDVRFPDGNGLDVCRRLAGALPHTRFMILTNLSDDSVVLAAAGAGARAVLPKDASVGSIVQAIRDVAADRSLLDPKRIAVAAARMEHPGTAALSLRTLTPRELGILEMIAEGKTDREIALSLVLSGKTVRNYVSTLLVKLGVRHRTEAAVMFTRLRASHDA